MVLLQQLLESQQRSFSAETDDFWWMLSAARKSVPACSAKSQRERETDRQTDRQTERQTDRIYNCYYCFCRCYVIIIIIIRVLLLAACAL